MVSLIGKIIFLNIYFLERGREGERDEEEHRLVACLEPSHVPQLGIEPATFRFTGWH